MDSKQTLAEIEKVYSSIINLLEITSGDGNFGEYIEYEDTPDERMLEEEIDIILDKLADVKAKFEYITKPVTKTGVLRKNRTTNYYELIFRGEAIHEYHAGSRIEALVMFEGKGTWTISRLEHNGDYYIVGNSEVELEGLQVRLR